MTELERFVDKHLDASVDVLATLVSQRTIAADQASPIEECVEFLEAHLRGLGAHVQVLRLPNARPVIFGEIRGRSARSVLFYQHYDVQPSGPTSAWRSDPFHLFREGDYLFGRGIADNKGNLAARLAAIRVLLDAEGELPITVRFLIEGEEEIGSPYLPAYLRDYDHLLRADACIWEGGYRDAEDRFVITLGIKGMCDLELRATGPQRDLHGKYAPLTINPATQLAAAISEMLRPDGHVAIPGYYDAVIDITAQDRVWLAAAAPDPIRLRDEIGLGSMPFSDGLDAIERLVFLSTGTVSGFSSGAVGVQARSIVPAEAVANVSFRLVPNQTPEAIHEMVKRFLIERRFEGIEVTLRGGVLPARTRSDDPLVVAAVSAVEAISGERPVVWPMSPGSGPMSLVCHSRGIPAITLGVGHAGSNTHAPDENIRLSDYRLGIHIMAELLRTLGSNSA